MKRILALFVAVSVGVTLAPIGVASASSGDRGGVSASASANAERAASTTSPQSAPFADSVDRKKKCTFMCVQSTLPGVQQEIYFVNGNRHLVSLNETNYTVRNLDTKRITTTRSLPTGVTYSTSSLSQSGNKLMIVGADDSGDLGFYDLNLETFALSPIEITGATYPLTTENLFEFQVDPSGSGFYLVQQVDGAKYLCFINALGAEVDCSETFLGTPGTSPLFFRHGLDNRLFIVGNALLFTFDTTDLTFTSVPIQGGLDTNGAMTKDGDMYFYGDVGPFDVGGGVIIFKLTTSGVLTTAYSFPTLVRFREIVVPTDSSSSVYLVGTPRKADGSQEKFSTVYNLDDDAGTLVMRKSFNIKTVRGQQPENLVIDSAGRYLLASGGGGKTSVIPADRFGSANIATTATYDVCLAGWQIDWDFANLAPGARVKGYALYYQAPNQSRWRKITTVASGREHTTLFTGGTGGLVKVLPVGVRVSGYGYAFLEDAPGAPSLIDRQPRC